MTRRKIDIWQNIGDILAALRKGVLLSTSDGQKNNSMVISWGAVGVEWGKPVFTAYVRESRFTKALLDKTGVFTVNILPDGTLPKNIFAVCGSKSGRELDKFAECSMTAIAGESVIAPAIKEVPLTLECRVLFKKEQPLAELPADAAEKFYSAGDPHTAYWGEIVNAYILEA